MSRFLSSVLRFAAIQLRVGADKTDNVQRAVEQIRKAVTQKPPPAAEATSTTTSRLLPDLKPRLVALPECFNSPYGTAFFEEYAEPVPGGYTTQRLADVAKELGVYVVGGTIPERGADRKLYNTCTVFNPEGELIAKYRKMHLFDVNVEGGIRFCESDVLSAGDAMRTIRVDGLRIGLGICYDLRFEEHARLYRNAGCDLLLYPAAFNMTTGPKHWELLQRSRANDLQLYVATVSPARDESAGYVAYGHSLVVNPWAEVVAEAQAGEEIVYADIDAELNARVRAQIPVSRQRRLDVYETVAKVEIDGGGAETEEK